MYLPGIRPVRSAIAAAAALGAMLAGCSDPGLYLDRRDTIALSGGDAVAGNAVAQMVDPWPPASGNTQIGGNGQKMQSAVERYRTDKVTEPVDPMQMQVANSSSLSSTSVQVNGAQNSNSAAGQ